MAIVTLSRLMGTTGDAIAEGVAQALQARLVTKATLYAAAQATGGNPTALAEMQAEGVVGFAERLLYAVRTMPTLPRSRGGSLLDASPMPWAHEGFLADVPTQAELDQSARVIESVIRNLAATGNVVIVGRASHAVLRSHPEAVHVQIVAPLAERVTVLAEAEHIDKRTALARIRASDRARADFVRRYYNIAWCDSTHYDLVINSAHVAAATAVQLIVATVQARASVV